MTEREFWQLRLVQTLHDPPHKALVLGTGEGHAKAALGLAHVVAGRALRWWNNAPDRLATGADRPLLGGNRESAVYWRNAPVITHPLQPGASMRVDLDRLPVASGVRAQNRAVLDKLVELWQQDPEAETGLPTLSEAGWDDLEALKRTQLALWRNLPELTRAMGLPGAWLPADSRCPDHSIASHLRVSAAASFVERIDRAEGKRDPSCEPTLLQVSVRGVQEYIRESRKARDLWTACMIFTELAWAAMEVIVRHYGPEAVLYPDLRENPLMDQWLMQNGYADAVPSRVREAGAGTFAAPVPNTFAALVPRGGAGHLLKVEDLAERCAAAVRERWRQMAGAVEEHLRERVGSGPWQQIYRRQLAADRAPEVIWTAVPWRRRMKDIGPPPEDLAALPGHAIPPGRLPVQLQNRHAALSPWLSDKVWSHYETARTVFWRMEALSTYRFLTDERGFDYAVVHHQLRAAVETRKLHEAPVPLDEPGEKCGLTGVHEALSNRPASATRDLRSARGAARGFWRDPRLGADNLGADRLGGPAALKRLLATSEDRAFLERWNGVDQPLPAKDDHTAPFPSTSALAMGRFLVEIGQRWEESLDLRLAASEVAAAHRRTSLPSETLHRLSMPRLFAFRERWADLDQLYKLEPQYLLPEVVRTHVEQAPKDSPERGAREALLRAVLRLHDIARGLKIQAPDTDVAILAMDGDSLSGLVLGDPDVIQARWRDVLHPDLVKRMKEEWPEQRPELVATGWLGLLEEKRTMGPSLHAALTSALAYFMHHVAGWVVEREFGGRLIYAGGDDLLAMLPGREAITCAARLQQLASAPFLVDTMPETVPWAWRRANGGEPPSVDGTRERQRFRVPVQQRGAPISLADNAWERHVAAGDDGAASALSGGWDIQMMLGRAHGLSAGISVGHYKTPLQSLITAARTGLNDLSKKRKDPNTDEKVKRALAVTHFSRGGSKYRFCAGWGLGSDETVQDGGWFTGPPHVQECLRVVTDAIQQGKLPSRLPYKLREDLSRVGALLYDPYAKDKSTRAAHIEARRALLTNLVVSNAGANDRAPIAAVVALLEAGLDHKQPEAGLLLARDLAAGGSHGAL